ncbi:MAG TPA: hypothetical protein VGH45_06200 [Solirubrobacteraceae bacterium]
MKSRVQDSLDLTRLAQLQHTLGVQLDEIVTTLLAELDLAVTGAETAIGDRDLAAAALAAHAGRNSALMIGADRLLDDLRKLETAAGGQDIEAARAALRRVQSSWAAFRVQLQAAGRGAR